MVVGWVDKHTFNIQSRSSVYTVITFITRTYFSFYCLLLLVSIAYGNSYLVPKTIDDTCKAYVVLRNKACFDFNRETLEDKPRHRKS